MQSQQLFYFLCKLQDEEKCIGISRCDCIIGQKISCSHSDKNINPQEDDLREIYDAVAKGDCSVISKKLAKNTETYLKIKICDIDEYGVSVGKDLTFYLMDHTPECFLRLLEEGVAVNETKCKGDNPLDYALRKNKIAIAEALLKNGAEANYRYEDGRTGLTHAVVFYGTDAVKLFLDYGADVNLPDNKGISPLLLAASFGDYYVIQDNRMIGSVELPPDGATGIRYYEITKLLLEHGADVEVKDEDGKTPLQKAIEYKHDEIAELLRQYGAKE